MSFQPLKPLMASLLLSGGIAAPTMVAMAQTDSSGPSKSTLETTVSNLQQEVASLKSELHGRRGSTSSLAGAHPVAPPTSAALSSRVGVLAENQTYLPFDLDVPGHAFVSTGPYVGVPIQFAGTDLIINSPSVNTDVQLLGIRKSILHQLAALGNEVQLPFHSHLLLSGIIEAQANYTNHGGAPSTTDIDVTNVSLDSTIFGPSEWLLGFLELTYDNSSPINNGIFESVSNYRVGNSRILVNKAFITIGDFAKSPFYGTVGQIYVPFGVYSTVMLSDPLDKTLGRTKARALELGFQQQTPQAFYGSAYIFRGDSHSNSVAKIRNGGLNLGYKFTTSWINGNIGGGVIANLADSVGMQLGTNFQEDEQLSHRVPAYNVRGTLSIGTQIDLIGEFVSATKEFSVNDMSYNGHGAKPWAFDLEAAYSFKILQDRPTSIGIGYSKSREALGMNAVPLTRTSLVLNTSFFRNTLQSLEFRHDRQYAASDYATGATGVVVTQTGKADNAVTAQFDYYF